jgi:mRNA interferase RelE/StbE
VSYVIEYAASVGKDLGELSLKMRKRAWDRIQELADDPFAPGVERLSGDLAGIIKARVGNYRIAYTVDSDTVCILCVGHRKNVYEKVRRGRR